jgi:hypothetical protein
MIEISAKFNWKSLIVRINNVILSNYHQNRLIKTYARTT